VYVGPFETKHKVGKKVYKRLQRKNADLHQALTEKQLRVFFAEWLVGVVSVPLVRWLQLYLD
jgi:hypothetical protein